MHFHVAECIVFPDFDFDLIVDHFVMVQHTIHLCVCVFCGHVVVGAKVAWDACMVAENVQVCTQEVQICSSVFAVAARKLLHLQ
jgi:hypothetical protein